MSAFIRLVLVVALAGAGVHAWRAHQETRTLEAGKTQAGFIPVPMPDGAKPDTVLVFAPANCPREGAQRARALVRNLTEHRVASVLTDHYAAQTFQPSPEANASFKRLNAVMTGDLPIVLVNGMGKANPTLEEVLSELGRTRRGEGT